MRRTRSLRWRTRLDAARIESHACKPPGDVGIPVTHGSAARLGAHVRAEGIETSDRTVGRILASADLQPHRQKMYLTSHDEDFRQKRDDVLHVYYDTLRRAPRLLG